MRVHCACAPIPAAQIEIFFFTILAIIATQPSPPITLRLILCYALATHHDEYAPHNSNWQKRLNAAHQLEIVLGMSDGTTE